MADLTLAGVARHGQHGPLCLRHAGTGHRGLGGPLKNGAGPRFWARTRGGWLLSGLRQLDIPGRFLDFGHRSWGGRDADVREAGRCCLSAIFNRGNWPGFRGPGRSGGGHGRCSGRFDFCLDMCRFHGLLDGGGSLRWGRFRRGWRLHRRRLRLDLDLGFLDQHGRRGRGRCGCRRGSGDRLRLHDLHRGGGTVHRQGCALFRSRWAVHALFRALCAL